MEALPVVHDRALAATRALVAGVPEDRWLSSTPCEDWDVRELLNHVVAGNLWVGELAGPEGKTIEEVGDRLDGDVLGEDPVAAYDTSVPVASRAFAREGAMDAPCAVSYGPVPGSVYCGHRIIDVLIHGWDIAVATGQDPTLDPALVEACWEIVEPQAELLAASGVFASRIEVPGDADPQTRLLAALGRRT